jgi:hypothetical protein
MKIGCGVCGADVEIEGGGSSALAGQEQMSGAVCWACGASVVCRMSDGTVFTNPADPEARYRVQRTTSAPASGRNHVGNFETFDQAQNACDRNYPIDPSGERQEITDKDTSEQWWRADGQEEWRLSRRGRLGADSNATFPL